jgi:group II intron reverse transcriptase/maturase
MIRHRDLFLAAYGKLYANKGATTPGVNPEDTVDGMSLHRIDRIIGQLEAGTYRWTPVKRVCIDKKRGGKRPLGLPGWNDKLVQEVIRLILEAYYEPRFADSSHGFRPGRGCHTALETIRRRWIGTKWFIEGDITGCYDNIDHDLLLDIIGRDIHDERFLKLLRGMLKAGYMEDWHYYQTFSGTVQGGVVSPILSNIVLNELDQYVENELIPRYTHGDRRRRNPEWRRVSRQMAEARRDRDIDRYRQLERHRRTIPSKDPNDDDYRRLKYCRYADDFILGYIGPKSEADEIKAQIGRFLKRIKLALSQEKTLVTHAAEGKARFLGYDIYVAHSDNRLTEYQRGNMMLKKRAVNGKIILNVPRDVTNEWCTRYSKNGKSIHRAGLLNSSDYEIVLTFNVEFQGLLNYYALAHNVAKRLSLVRYTCLQSLVKTLAAKYRRPTSWVYRSYTRKLENGRKVIAVIVPRDPPKKPLVSIFGAHSLARDANIVIKDQTPRMYLQRTELIQRLLSSKCELCGATESIEVHHVRKLKDVRKKYRGQEPPPWAAFILGKRRKTVAVCQLCHHSIHAGTYDGPRLN